MSDIESELLKFDDENIERQLKWRSIVPGLVEHYGLLERWNPIHNLTREIEPARAALVHYRDSFLGLWEIRSLFTEAKSVFDVGSGGGLPGVVLALMYPEVHLTFIEKVSKKASFLKLCSKGLNISVESKSIFDCSDAELLVSRATFPWSQLAPLAAHGSICIGFVSGQPNKADWLSYCSL